MSAIMVTGPCHGKVLELIHDAELVKIPFLRDEEGWLYITYKFLLKEGDVSYYIPRGSTLNQAFAELVGRG